MFLMILNCDEMRKNDNDFRLTIIVALYFMYLLHTYRFKKMLNVFVTRSSLLNYLCYATYFLDILLVCFFFLFVTGLI